MCGVFAQGWVGGFHTTPSNSLTPAGCAPIKSNPDTIYPEILAGSTG